MSMSMTTRSGWKRRDASTASKPSKATRTSCTPPARSTRAVVSAASRLSSVTRILAMRATGNRCSRPMTWCAGAHYRSDSPRTHVMPVAADPRENDLLAALPPADWTRWQPQLERADLPLGHVVYESGHTMSHVFFPTTAIVSLLYVMENGASAEIAVVGHEGIVGVSLFMGGESTPTMPSWPTTA